MRVRHFEDLIVWQLAFELEKEVFAFTAFGPAGHDFKFRDQIRHSSASATRNTAEGFRRFRQKQHEPYLSIAYASLEETRSHLHTAHLRRYLSTPEHDRLVRLAIRALGANVGLIRYLKSCDPDDPFFGPKNP